MQNADRYMYKSIIVRDQVRACCWRDKGHECIVIISPRVPAVTFCHLSSPPDQSEDKLHWHDSAMGQVVMV